MKRATEKFIEAIKAKEPTLYLGGLSHRLAAEALGACTYIANDDFGILAGHNPTLNSTLFPRNVLLVNTHTYQNPDLTDEVRALCNIWNHIVDCVELSTEFRRDLSQLVQDAINKHEKSANSVFMHSAGFDFNRIVPQVMLQFCHLNPPESSDSSVAA